jgi:hypothetical protein
MAKAPQKSSSGAPQDRKLTTFNYIDRPEVTETFADSVNAAYFDGQTLRLEFGVTRVNNLKPNEPLTGRRYPACRLVLSPVAATDLINRLQQIATALTRAGVLKQTEPPGAAEKSKS